MRSIPSQLMRHHYNADGERVLQRNSDVETFYVGTYHEKDMTHSVRTTYYTFGGARVGMRQNNDVFWLHGDHLGSASLTTNITGAAVSEMRYYPFGETRWVSGTLPTDRLFTGQRELYLLSQFADALMNLSNHGVVGIDLFGTPEDLDRTIRFLRCMSVSGATTDGCR